jgi:hypothetical protein
LPFTTSAVIRILQISLASIGPLWKYGLC